MLINCSSLPRLGLDKRKILAIAFAVSALGSWVYILGPAANYMNYYSALSQLYIDVNNVSNTTSPSSNTLSFNFTITNPTPYIGLTFQFLSYDAILPNQTGRPITIAVGTANPSGFASLQPNSPIEVQTNYVLTGLGMKQFNQLCQQANDTLSWSISGVVTLGTRDGSLYPNYGAGPTSQC
jgi:hypothetical protein